MEHAQRYVIFKNNDGKIPRESKDVLREKFEELPAGGTYQVTVEDFKPKRFSPTRYRYYFDCVLGLAFTKVRERFRLVAPKTGDMRNPADVEELHHCLKLKYNPIYIFDEATGVMLTIGATTTDLSDTDFIYEFTEEIVADFSGAPYYAYPDTGCPTREEWALMHKENTWNSFKNSYTKS